MNTEWLVYILVNYHVHWTLLPKEMRYLGYRRDWYDGPIYNLGLWWGHFYVIDKYFCCDEERE